jgi:glycosyltransferase involved in cell wall biosynthesis
MTEGSRPLVSVVIPTHQRRELLRCALEALTRQDLDPASFEVIVSVDASTDGTLEMLERFDAPYVLRSVTAQGRGRAAACNAAISLARADVLVILDDDMEPRPECLRAHFRNHPIGSRVCVMGAVPIHTDATSPPVTRYVAAKFNDHLARLASPDHVFALRDFYSGNASIRREILLEVGAFDETYTTYGNEDLELSLRLRNGGVELRYDPEAAADQKYTKSLAELTQDTFEKGETAVLFATAHPGAFDGLQLSTYGSSSPRWQSARAGLLAATRVCRPCRRWVVRLAQTLEKIRTLQRPLFYRFVLDYFYWAGVETALGESPATVPLAELADDLRRGPLRLLLHR